MSVDYVIYSRIWSPMTQCLEFVDVVPAASLCHVTGDCETESICLSKLAPALGKAEFAVQSCPCKGLTLLLTLALAASSCVEGPQRTRASC